MHVAIGLALPRQRSHSSSAESHCKAAAREDAAPLRRDNLPSGAGHRQFDRRDLGAAAATNHVATVAWTATSAFGQNQT
jgi:hypothetical protein